jgi:hypothetical protein
MKKFSFKAQVWKWPGDMGWHFVSLPKSLARKIKSIGKTYGSGFVRVKVCLGDSSWITALFPHKESETYILSIKKAIRKKEGIFEDSKVKISFELSNRAKPSSSRMTATVRSRAVVV